VPDAQSVSVTQGGHSATPPDELDADTLSDVPEDVAALFWPDEHARNTVAAEAARTARGYFMRGTSLPATAGIDDYMQPPT